MLQVEELGKSFAHNGTFIEVLKDISLVVEDGEFLCLLGPSGCGKTTLLRCIGGYEKVSRGQIFMDGHKIYRPGIDRVMVFQGFEQLFSWKTVKANIEYPLIINGVDKRKRKNLVRQYLELIKLEDYADYYPHQLSGGMKQRTAIARALALEPPVLLMDEPFGNLDAQTKNTMQKELRKIMDEIRATVIFVTHDIEEAILLSDRIVMMSQQPGRIKTIFDNKLKFPRVPSMEGFASMWDLLYKELGHPES